MASKDTVGLHNLEAPKGSSTEPKRKGRGPGSGLGKTAGRGHKGQRSRKSGNVPAYFEGGQMPLTRRVPKRGFTNPFRVPTQIVNVRDLTRLPDEAVNPALLVEHGLVIRLDRPIKILGTGEATRAYRVTGCAVSKTAQAKIERAGGKIEA